MPELHKCVFNAIVPMVSGFKTDEIKFKKSCSENPSDGSGICNYHLQIFFDMRKIDASFLRDHEAEKLEPNRLTFISTKSIHDKNRIMIPFRNHWRTFFKYDDLTQVEKYIFLIIYEEINYEQLCENVKFDSRSILNTSAIEDIYTSTARALDVIKNSMSACIKSNWRREYTPSNVLAVPKIEILAEPPFIRNMFEIALVPKTYYYTASNAVTIAASDTTTFTKEGLVFPPIYNPIQKLFQSPDEKIRKVQIISLVLPEKTKRPETEPVLKFEFFINGTTSFINETK